MGGILLENLPSYKQFDADLKKIYISQEQAMYSLVVVKFDAPDANED